MHVLDAKATACALPYAQLVPAIAQAARELADGVLHAPERMVVPLTGADVLLAMPAVARDLGITKLITVQPGNAARGRPAIQGEMIVFDTSSGERVLLADGPTVTARRTAAVTLLGVELLSPEPPKSALLIGTGVQAHTHLEALHDYFGIHRFWIAGTGVQRAHDFIRFGREAFPQVEMTPLAASELPAEGVGSDVVVALTTARTPVVPPDLPAGTLAVGVGAFRPEMTELPAALLHRRIIVVDHLHGARAEAGDLIQAGIDWQQVVDLPQCLATPLGATHRPAVFKTVGHAAWDLAAARVLLAVESTCTPSPPMRSPTSIGASAPV